MQWRGGFKATCWSERGLCIIKSSKVGILKGGGGGGGGVRRSECLSESRELLEMMNGSSRDGRLKISQVV